MNQDQQEDSGILLQKRYQIPYALFKTAFTAFQKKFVYPRNYVIIGILGIVCMIYAYFVVNGSESDRPMYCIVILCALLMIIFQILNPLKIRKNLMLAVHEIENDQYQLTIYPEYLEIGTILPPEDAGNPENSGDISDSDLDALFDDTPGENFSGTRIYYNKNLRVHEYHDFFMIYQQKTMFYVVPKAVFSEEELEIMRVHFAQKLDQNFSES
ncbi:MAG: YcxB family protein [Oscillospiraceae bacterium]|nr:YcxB family protein [Oscillospiraceae bacterium]